MRSKLVVSWVIYNERKECSILLMKSRKSVENKINRSIQVCINTKSSASFLLKLFFFTSFQDETNSADDNKRGNDGAARTVTPRD